MKMKLGYAGAALAVALLGGTAAQAQGKPCDNGRGVITTDLGFKHLDRKMKSDAKTRRMELIFASEPRISGVRANGPAVGRLHNGDMVVAIEGHPITTPAASRAYSDIRPGERVRFSVRRGGRVQDVTVTAAARCMALPPAPAAPPVAAAPDAPAAPVPPNPPVGGELLPQGRFGFTIDCNDCGEDERTGLFRFRQAPVIERVQAGSPAARAGLQAGDRLTHVNGVSLTGEMGWPHFNALQPGETVRFTYIRGGYSHEATLTAN